MLLAALLVMVGLTALAVPLARRFGRNAGYPLAAGFLVAAALLAPSRPVVLEGSTVAQSWSWIPSLGVSFALRMDGLSGLFATLVLLVGALVLAYTARYLQPDATPARLYALLSGFATAMLGLVLADDVVTLFVCWELTTMCSFFLIGGHGTAGAQPATRAMLVTGGGGLALLGAVALLVVASGTTDLSAILADPARVFASGYALPIGVLVIVAAFTKSAQWPFSFWLPGAMVALTPVSAYLHAATMVKAGIYLLLRFSPIYADQPVWTYVLLGTGLLTAVVGAVLALKQHDLKALLAYSTVSQLGFLVAATGVGTSLALAAVATHTFAHALFKATLFMLVGIIDREAGSRDIRELSGLRKAMPVTATLTAVAALSMAGVPPMLGFVSKETLFDAFRQAPGATPGPAWVGPLAGGLAVLAAALTFAYGARIFVGAFAGPLRQRSLYEPAPAFLAPAAVPAVATILLGLGVGVLNPLVNRLVLDVAPRPEPAADLALWHGFTPALGMTAATIGLGLLLYAARDPLDAALQRRRLPATGAQLFDGLYDATLRLGAAVGAPSVRGGVSAHLVAPLALVVALAPVAVLARPALPDPKVTWIPADWVVLGLLVPAVLALALAHSRLAAIALLGAVGFLVAVQFLLVGGVDLALTQLLVEVLTVVVAVFVLRQQPRHFASSSARRTWTGVLGAAAAGTATAVGVYALTGRRDLSPAGSYLLDQAGPQTGGSNVVNTILVDFRGLDTLGEITVLAAASIGVAALVSQRDDLSETAGALPHSVLLVTAQRLLGPGVLILSAWLLLRGHYQPGGGFIAGLVGGIAVVLQFLVNGTGGLRRVQFLRASQLIAIGLTVAVLVGLLGLVLSGSFLDPVSISVPLPAGRELSLSSSLVFDVGVYLIVVALVLRATQRLGTVAGDSR